MAHRQGHLSDETIERIADRVADRLRLAVYAGDDALLTVAEAAEMLKRAPGTLETWRRIGIGPQVVRLGRPRRRLHGWRHPRIHRGLSLRRLA